MLGSSDSRGETDFRSRVGFEALACEHQAARARSGEHGKSDWVSFSVNEEIHIKAGA